MPIPIQIDRSKCRGAGACVQRAPGTFGFDEERKSRLLDPQRDDTSTILDAVGACPYFALAVVEVPMSAPAPDAGEGSREKGVDPSG